MARVKERIEQWLQYWGTMWMKRITIGRILTNCGIMYRKFPQSSTESSPFNSNYGYHLCFDGIFNSSSTSNLPLVEEYVKTIHQLPNQSRRICLRLNWIRRLKIAKENDKSKFPLRKSVTAPEPEIQKGGTVEYGVDCIVDHLARYNRREQSVRWKG